MTEDPSPRNPRRERDNADMMYLHDITDQKKDQVEYRERRRIEVGEEEAERLHDAWHWIVITSGIFGIVIGVTLLFFDPLTRVLTILAGLGAFIFKWQASQTTGAKRRSFVYLITTLFTAATLLFLLLTRK